MQQGKPRPNKRGRDESKKIIIIKKKKPQQASQVIPTLTFGQTEDDDSGNTTQPENTELDEMVVRIVKEHLEDVKRLTYTYNNDVYSDHLNMLLQHAAQSTETEDRCLTSKPDTIDRINNLKSQLTRYTSRDVKAVRSDVAPFESLTQALETKAEVKLCNRAGWKLCEMDHLTRECVLGPAVRSGGLVLALCEGPGSWINYLAACVDFPLLGELRASLHVLGVTLKSSTLDFQRIHLGTGVRFEKYYGPFPSIPGANTGDITDPLVQAGLECRVKEEGMAKLVMADGGFEIDKDELNDQEALTFNLLHAEILVALRCVAPRGAVIIKTFQTSNASTMALTWMGAVAFRQTIWMKPRTSRAASSEGYVVFLDFQLQADERQSLVRAMSALQSNRSPLALRQVYSNMSECVPQDYLDVVSAFNAWRTSLQIDMLNVMTMALEHNLRLQDRSKEELRHVSQAVANTIVQTKRSYSLIRTSKPRECVYRDVQTSHVATGEPVTTQSILRYIKAEQAQPHQTNHYGRLIVTNSEAWGPVEYYDAESLEDKQLRPDFYRKWSRYFGPDSQLHFVTRRVTAYTEVAIVSTAKLYTTATAIRIDLSFGSPPDLRAALARPPCKQHPEFE